MNSRNSDRVLWMGDLDRYMDGNFIGDGFKKMGLTVVNIKIVMDKYDGHRAGYCFVELQDAEAARTAMLHVNGKVIPNSRPPVKFNLSFANNPSAGTPEYNLFVNNLPDNVGDAELYQIFGNKFASCRGAKVYRHPDGSCKGMGFVRFGDETDQQRALVEMNRQMVLGRPISLKLAPVRIRQPKFNRQQEYDPSGYYRQYQDYYNSSSWQMYDLPAGQRNSSSSGRGKSTDEDANLRRKQKKYDPEIEPFDEEEHMNNNDFMEDNEALFRNAYDSCWYPSVHTAAVTFDDI